jgi:hypothetical protein
VVSALVAELRTQQQSLQVSRQCVATRYCSEFAGLNTRMSFCESMLHRKLDRSNCRDVQAGAAVATEGWLQTSVRFAGQEADE